MNDITLQEAIEFVELMRLEGHEVYFKSHKGKVTLCSDYILIGNPNFAECLVETIQKGGKTK